MGRDKCLIAIAGKTLLQRVVDTLREVTDDLVIVGPRERAGQVHGVPVVPDVVPNAGPIAGITAALRASVHPYCLVVACDMPFLHAGLLRYLIQLAPSFDVVIPDVDGFTHQTHAVYSKACLSHLEPQLAAGDFRLTSLLTKVRVRYVRADEIERFDPEHRSLMNVNTPEELATAERLVEY